MNGSVAFPMTLGRARLVVWKGRICRKVLVVTPRSLRAELGDRMFIYDEVFPMRYHRNKTTPEPDGGLFGSKVDRIPPEGLNEKGEALVKTIEVYQDSKSCRVQCRGPRCTDWLTWAKVVKSGAKMCFTGTPAPIATRVEDGTGRIIEALPFAANHWAACPDRKKF